MQIRWPIGAPTLQNANDPASAATLQGPVANRRVNNTNEYARSQHGSQQRDRFASLNLALSLSAGRRPIAAPGRRAFVDRDLHSNFAKETVLR
jgi:hypothetical protein